MAWSELKDAIHLIIKENGAGEITGTFMQQVLDNIVDTLGKNRTFAGFATTTTNPGIHDENVFYLATNVGLYPNFSAIEILNKGLYTISYLNGSWVMSKLFDDVDLQGIKGDTGSSAYQSYLDTTTDNPVKTEQEWSTPIKGDTGDSAYQSYLNTTTDNPVMTEGEWAASIIANAIALSLKADTTWVTEQLSGKISVLDMIGMPLVVLDEIVNECELKVVLEGVSTLNGVSEFYFKVMPTNTNITQHQIFGNVIYSRLGSPDGDGGYIWDAWFLASDSSLNIKSDTSVKYIFVLTQAEYDAITEKDLNTLYFIKQA